MDASKLKSVELFSSLSNEDLERIAQWTDEVEIDTGHHLIRQDGFGYEFFVILEGSAEVMDGEVHLADMTAGVEYLKQLPVVDTARGFGTTGFCYGGNQTFLLAIGNPDIRVAVPYYGMVDADQLQTTSVTCSPRRPARVRQK